MQTDLFNNPMVENAIKQLSPEDLQKYKNIGEKLYGNIEMMSSNGLTTNGSNSEAVPDNIMEAIFYICEGLKSGLLPEDLEEDEQNLLKEFYGNDWVEKITKIGDEITAKYDEKAELKKKLKNIIKAKKDSRMSRK
jgi:hypothetical protein